MGDEYKITHDFSDIEAGKEYVMQLKNKSIFDEEPDELENTQLLGKKRKDFEVEEYKENNKLYEQEEKGFKLSQVAELAEEENKRNKMKLASVEGEKKFMKDYEKKIRPRNIKKKRKREADSSEIAEILEKNNNTLVFDEDNYDLTNISEFKKNKIDLSKKIKREEVEAEDEIGELISSIKVRKRQKTAVIPEIKQETVEKREERVEETPEALEEVKPQGNLFEEVNCRRGAANALKYLRSIGALADNKVRKRNKEKNPLEMEGADPSLMHRDKDGVVMSQKEAFRQHCYEVYREKPSAKKQLKMQKKQEKEDKLKNKDLVQISKTKKLVDRARKKGKAFVFIQGNNN